ncbi:MAG: AmmeMemoRadiSam system radical SAM enzyme [Candidatus Lernaella stagnicola]|nr:AmmeMemoRadiSam system radical SAM enzyme [Candidatus Lernaella stagnicola]
MKEKDLARRDFLFAMAGTGCAFLTGCERSNTTQAMAAPPLGNQSGHAARFWHADGENIQCDLCPQGCTIASEKMGFCRVRRNDNGKLVSLVYGQPVTHHNDPIEKKPFNHVLPGSKAFSVATVGCNMTCKHCQNWQLSQATPGDLRSLSWSPAELAKRAKAAGSATIAFTYNEPTIWPEYIIDTAVEAKKLGVRTVVVSNGFINEAPQRELAKNILAYKVDLKGFSEKFYRDICGASLKPVLEGMVRIREEKCWLEIVTLVIPTLNDDPQEIRALAKWVYTHLGADVPLHFTRFHPMFQLRNLPRTPVPTLEKARQVALDAGLRYVYTGNVPGHPGTHTYCPKCGEKVIQRYGFTAKVVALDDGRCAKCGTAIPGVWS